MNYVDRNNNKTLSYTQYDAEVQHLYTVHCTDILMFLIHSIGIDDFRNRFS
jgi:hypothetical protein